MTNQPMWRSRHVHWPKGKIKGSSGQQKAIKQDSEHKLNEMKKQKGTHISNMTRNFGTNLRSVLPKTLYEQDCQQIHDFLFFPLVSTGESIYLRPSVVLFIGISWPGLCISKAPVAPKQYLFLLISSSSLKGVIAMTFIFFSVIFKTRENSAGHVQ